MSEVLAPQEIEVIHDIDELTQIIAIRCVMEGLEI